MNMKRLLTVVCVAMLTIAASAQITWNVKAGAGVATLWGSGSEGAKPHVVAKIGVGIEKPFSSNFSLMPSLEVALKGVKFENKRYTNDGIYDLNTTIDLLYVQVPILVAYRFNLSDAWNMTLKAGPYAAYEVYEHTKFSLGSESVSSSNKLEVKKFDAGVDVGFDIEYHRFVFGVEAEMGFLSLLGNSTDIKNLAFYATIGYKF